MKLYANKLGLLAFLSNISLSMVTSDPFNMMPILDSDNFITWDAKIFSDSELSTVRSPC